MRNILLLFFALCWQQIAFSQSTGEKIAYIIDSIPVLTDPAEGDDITDADVADITTIKDKEALRRLGYEQFDGVTYLFTKEYRNRSEEDRKIPSAKQMERRNDVFYFHGIPYNGNFTDYFWNGKKQGEGHFVNGKLEGLRKIYYRSGVLSSERHYRQGIPDGEEREYFEDGSLKQKGIFADGKEEGTWESYFPNGQVKLRSKYQLGQVYDTATKFYSTGRIKEKVFIKNGEVVPDAHLVVLQQWMKKSEESNKAGNTKKAIKYCNEAIAADSNYAEAYYSRATILLNEFRFDEAINDFDKALQLEPYMEFALANRAFARIRKYQYAGAREISRGDGVMVLASKDRVTIPDAEKEKICSDLQKAIFLGDKTDLILQALADYCKASARP